MTSLISPTPVRPRLRGVLFDAMGTLITLDPPGPHLAHALRARGVEITDAEASAAFVAEVGFYRDHHDEGRDAVSLTALRHRAAEVLHAALPPSVAAAVPVADLLPIMLDSLRFAAYPEVAEALRRLRAARLRLAVVSNWDVSLPEVLDRVGLADGLDLVLASAEVGAGKPDPAIFGRAADDLGIPPAALVHVGDQAELDVVGARAAGVSPILVLREESERRTAPDGIDVVANLTGAAELILGRLAGAAGGSS